MARKREYEDEEYVYVGPENKHRVPVEGVTSGASHRYLKPNDVVRLSPTAARAFGDRFQPRRAWVAQQKAEERLREKETEETEDDKKNGDVNNKDENKE